MDDAADDDNIRWPLSSGHIANRKVSRIVSRNQQGLSQQCSQLRQ